ncbi:Protein strawberry notch-like 2, partial [Acipenser ruthenus]
GCFQLARSLLFQGALTHGDRRATESRDLSKYNFENKYGTRALDKIIKAIMGQIESKVPTPKGYPGGDAMFFRDMKRGLMDVGIFCREPRFGVGVEKDCSITKFLNRILGLEVYKQNSLFQYFTDNFDYLIEKDKKEGKYDLGILDLAPGNDEIYEETQEKFLTPGNPQDGQVVLYKVCIPLSVLHLFKERTPTRTKVWSSRNCMLLLFKLATLMRCNAKLPLSKTEKEGKVNSVSIVDHCGSRHEVGRSLEQIRKADRT